MFKVPFRLKNIYKFNKENLIEYSMTAELRHM